MREAVGYAFGPFVLLPGQQKLLHDGSPVRIRGRALDILALLVARPGEVIEKNDLIAGAWPNIFVDESNLKVNIAALRRVLGDGKGAATYIATVSGRGYRFVAPVRMLADAPRPEGRAALGPGQLPPHLGRQLIGRAEVVSALRDELLQSRLVTIVGPGGIGKTSVALAVARESADHFRDGTVFLDLSPIAEPRFVAPALASTLGLSLHSEHVVPALNTHLLGRSMLIVLDGCEHLIEAVAILAEDVLTGTTSIRIMATSREPLSIAHEHVHRLPALETPADPAAMTARSAMTYSAVQLFVERARARSNRFELTDANAPVATSICQRLDGMALAIELAATRVDMFSLSELLSLLNDRFRLLEEARRSRIPRQRSLAATLDWSYSLLSDAERRVLQHLSVFAGQFTLESAGAILAEPNEVISGASAVIASLVAKSLVQSDVSGPIAFYRLLDTTRIYARGHLLAAEDASDVMRRHANHIRDLAERSEADWGTLPTPEWLALYGRAIDDVRSALGWAFSDGGDVEMGLALTVAAIPLWDHLSLLDECRSSVERALASQAARAGEDGNQVRMKLCGALGTAILHTKGPLPAGRAAWAEAYEIAHAAGEHDYQLRALWALCDYCTWSGDHRAALATVAKIRDLATALDDRLALVNVDRQAGTALRYLGRQGEARATLERMISNYAPPLYRSHIARFQFDPRVGARGTLANILWLQGYPEQAQAMAERALREAEAAGHAMALCNALGHTACPIALYVGDLGRAETLLARLDEHVARHAMGIWKAVAGALRGVLLVSQEQASGVQTLLNAIEAMRDVGFRLRYPAYLGVLAVGLSRSGDAASARLAIEEAIVFARRSGEIWCIAELLRVQGELLRRDGLSDAAEQCFRRAQRWSRRQGSRSFEVRAATSLARLYCDSGRADAAAAILAPVYDSFDEGWDTADLVAARELAGCGLVSVLA
ncbi:MAG TPA: winged helix-turn-helix domain-containing protein [Bosea sp. (in: a-proteobacteria)]|uniref:ATP-binding protein n=1 Tax=Bosea sp. (in: a-proteobacteria) TaxID=1871050 RepID=UPI002E0E5398|nr:winged helix-turn-helix domain-containing protein [Bosea sp. (in: a-proteobacteria)]